MQEKSCMEMKIELGLKNGRKEFHVKHFDEWLAGQPSGTQTRIFKEIGISYGTQWKAQNRVPLGNYKTAKALSEETGGEVSIEALCEPEPFEN